MQVKGTTVHKPGQGQPPYLGIGQELGQVQIPDHTHLYKMRCKPQLWAHSLGPTLIAHFRDQSQTTFNQTSV